MILGIGTDLLRMSRIPEASLRPGDPFLEKTFTLKEQAQAEERLVPRDYYCTRFASKEAVFKALGADPDKVRLCDIEVLDDVSGAPSVTLHGALKEHAERRGIDRIHISISYDDGLAQAFAVAESNR